MYQQLKKAAVVNNASDVELVISPVTDLSLELGSDTQATFVDAYSGKILARVSLGKSVKIEVPSLHSGRAD